MSIKVGAYVWLPCEVKPGAFPNERIVRLASEFGAWVGFVSESFLKEPVTEGKTLVRALVVDVQGDRFLAKLPGESLSRTLFQGALSQVRSGDPVEARHP